MPPKRKPTRDSVVRIDPNKHAAQLKEIELSQKQYQAELAAIEEQERYYDNLEEEEEMGEEEEEDGLDYSMYVEHDGVEGRIDLSFPETADRFADTPECYPESYYTLSSKERLLLLYAENFRKQFFINFPNRRPLVLALPNECDVQKFVCTTIRPTAFLHIPLIGNVEGCARFVADFIVFEPLEFLVQLVS